MRRTKAPKSIMPLATRRYAVVMCRDEIRIGSRIRKKRINEKNIER